MPVGPPDGTACFLDANIFYYHFVESGQLSERCTELLARAATGAISTYTSTHLLAEAMHMVMIAEAAARFALTRTSLVNWLQANRPRIGELSEFREAAREMAAIPVQCVPLTAAVLPRAAGIAKDLCLLTNDAITVALMRDRGLTHLATNDDDFDDIPGLQVWKPR